MSTKSKRRIFNDLTEAESAHVLSITPRHFRRLVADGVFRKPAGGKAYELVEIVASWTKYIERGRTAEAFGKARMREQLAEARIKEARAGVLEGELVSAEGVRDAMSNVFGQIAAAIDGAAGRMTGEIHRLCGGDRGRIQALVLAEQRLIRKHAAELVGDLCKKRMRRQA